MSRLSGSHAMTKKRKISVSQETFDDFLADHGMQSDGTGYRCVDHLDTIIVVYYAENEKTPINTVTVVASLENTEQAAAIATVVALSLNPKYLSLPTESPTGKKIFRSLQDEIQTKMEHVFVHGGSDLSMSKEAMFMYGLNNNKDMCLVMVTPLTKD
jgi:hypothetical protein